MSVLPNDPLQELLAVGCASARALPLGTLGGYVAARAISPFVGVSLGVALAAALSLLVLPGAAAIEASAVPFVIASELAIGLLLGLSAVLPLFAFEWAGVLLDQTRGDAARTPIFAQLYALLAAAAFFSLGGPRALAELYVGALRSVPVGVAPPNFSLAAWSAVELSMHALSLSLAIALPVWAPWLVGRVVLAASARASSRVSTGLVPLLAALVGTMLVAMVLPVTLESLAPAVRYFVGAARVFVGSPAP